MKVVNDSADRAIALMWQYNSSLAKNEEQKQLLLCIVERHRKQYPTCTKSALMNTGDNEEWNEVSCADLVQVGYCFLCLSTMHSTNCFCSSFLVRDELYCRINAMALSALSFTTFSVEELFFIVKIRSYTMVGGLA